jgi:NADH dehydrogenase ubiquinone Fe-S protein 4
MMVARIYRPAKTAMQSGRANTKEWMLDFEPGAPRGPDPLMGWTSTTDMQAQVHLSFDTKEQAVAYAECAGIPYRVFEPNPRRPNPKSYSDNFRADRKQPWSH